MITNMPTGTDIIAVTDPYAAVVNVAYNSLGVGLSNETNTAAYYAAQARQAIEQAFPGAINTINTFTGLPHYDRMLKAGAYALFGALESQVNGNLPVGWNFGITNGVVHTLDSWMQRINGTALAAIAGATAAPVIAATGVQGGQIPNCTSAYCPLVQFTYVGAYDHIETLPTPSSAGVAISGNANALNVTIPGPIPSGITKVRMYRTLVGQSSPLCWAGDVAVTVGATNTVVTLSAGDQSLRSDINPPSWISYLWRPETAFLYNLAWSSSQASVYSSSDLFAPLTPSSVGMASANVVSMNPVNMFIGVGNNITPSSYAFGLMQVGSAYSASGFPLGLNNNIAYNQGFIGATGIRARSLVNLNGTYTPTISYTYYNASNPLSGAALTQASATPTAGFAGTGVGEIITWNIPAGTVVTSINQTSATGTATAGQFIYEAVEQRALYA